MNERRNDLEIMNWIPQIALQIQNSDRSPLYDVRNPAGKVCEDVACEVMFRGRLFEAPCSSIASIFEFHLVEPDGIEPTTSCLQSTRSPS